MMWLILLDASLPSEQIVAVAQSVSQCNALAGFHVECDIALGSQEFSGGGKLFVGAFEARNAICLADNPANISLSIDCTRSRTDARPRGQGQSARSRLVSVTTEPLPEGVRELLLPINDAFAAVSRVRTDLLSEALEAVFDALAAGQNVLLFCMNAKHRSLVSHFICMTTHGSLGVVIFFFKKNIIEEDLDLM